jgi:hypothetical protein
VWSGIGDGEKIENWGLVGVGIWVFDLQEDGRGFGGVAFIIYDVEKDGYPIFCL